LTEIYCLVPLVGYSYAGLPYRPYL